jgi:hypothetical protein
MKGIAGYLAGALVLGAAAGAALVLSTIEREIARTQQKLVTMTGGEDERTLDRAERYFEYGALVPWIGSGPLNDLRARRAALRYWRQQYSGIVPREEDPVGNTAPDNVELQFVVANAMYRAGQAGAADRAAAQQVVEKGVDAYLTVLRNAASHEDAAHNYEFLLRTRDELAKGRRKAALPPPPPPGGPMGRAGAPAPRSTNADDFNVYVPLESDERDKAEAQKKLEGERNQDAAGAGAGKTPPKPKKG